jgi:hypothetical protein
MNLIYLKKNYKKIYLKPGQNWFEAKIKKLKIKAKNNL